MSELYNAEYYHGGCGPIPYEQPEHWVEFFGVIADKIVADFHPKTVLDAGCAMGYLVAALRDRGVEAYGVDISEYAISQVREDIRPYCKVGSLVEQLPEGLPARYDLVVTIEVLEHLYEDEGKRAIQHLCELSDQVLFSSTPDDFTERTHVNVQQREYWCRVFFENGFLDDINYRPKYLTSHAVLFRRSENFGRQVEDYERNIRMSENEYQQSERRWSQAVEDKERHIRNITEIQVTAENEWKQEKQKLEAKLNGTEKQYQAQLLEQAQSAQQKIDSIETKAKSDMEQIQQELQREQMECESQIKKAEKLQNELEHYKEHYYAAINQREELKVQLSNSDEVDLYRQNLCTRRCSTCE